LPPICESWNASAWCASCCIANVTTFCSDHSLLLAASKITSNSFSLAAMRLRAALTDVLPSISVAGKELSAVQSWMRFDSGRSFFLSTLGELLSPRLLDQSSAPKFSNGNRDCVGLAGKSILLQYDEKNPCSHRCYSCIFHFFRESEYLHGWCRSRPSSRRGTLS
jgi:hypothetical protein